jgi:hypothetical protein
MPYCWYTVGAMVKHMVLLGAVHLYAAGLVVLALRMIPWRENYTRSIYISFLVHPYFSLGDFFEAGRPVNAHSIW